uniref:Uncharacterized protein n=2 Tax=Emiliania huxleyi TaxID=2903 RepID=A0A7S3SUP0_EMIHU
MLLEGRRKDLAAKETLRKRRRAKREAAFSDSLAAARRLSRGRASAVPTRVTPPDVAPAAAPVAPTAAVPAGAAIAAEAMRGMLTRRSLLDSTSWEENTQEESNAAAGVIQRRWKRARSAVDAETLAKRWHKDNNTFCKRLCLQCRRSHTLCFFDTRGSSYTRAQTTMILVNSLAFELVMLCLTYQASDGALVINIVGVVISGTVCALIVVPTMVTFAWLYHPATFVRVGLWCAKAFFCWPVWLGKCCCRASCKVAPSVEEAEAGVGASEASVSLKAWAAVAAAQSRARLEKLEPEQRNFSYQSLNDVVLKASPFHSWQRRDWKAMRLITFGWGSNLLALIAMSFTFAAYGCELFEPGDFSNVDAEGMSWAEGAAEYARLSNITLAEQLARGDFGIAWALSAFQRFVLHEPTLIFAAKGLPVLFASASSVQENRGAQTPAHNAKPR